MANFFDALIAGGPEMWIVLIVAAIIGFVGVIGPKLKIYGRINGAFKAIAIAGVLLSIVSLSGVLSGFGTPAATVVDDQPAFKVTGVADTGATYNSVSHKFTVPLAYNSTSAAIVTPANGSVAMHFIITRATSDVNTDDAVATCELGNAQTILVDTAEKTMLAKNADKTYKCYFQPVGGVAQYESCNVLVSQGVASQVNVTLDLNDAAYAGLETVGDSAALTLEIAGETFTVEVVINSIVA